MSCGKNIQGIPGHETHLCKNCIKLKDNTCAKKCMSTGFIPNDPKCLFELKEETPELKVGDKVYVKSFFHRGEAVLKAIRPTHDPITGTKYIDENKQGCLIEGEGFIQPFEWCYLWQCELICPDKEEQIATPI